MSHLAPDTQLDAPIEKYTPRSIAYDAGVKDTVEYFRKEFAKWAANQYGAGQRCLSFSEMLEESIKELLKDKETSYGG